MKNDEVILVRWKTRGSWITNGQGFPRKAGDEDEMVVRDARPLIKCGMIEVVGAITSIPAIGYMIEKDLKSER